MSEKLIPEKKAVAKVAITEVLVPEKLLPKEIETFSILNKVEDAKALFVFAHGAGADLEHSFMQQITQLLNFNDISVLRFNFNYMDRRRIEGTRRPPDRMPKLLRCYKSVLAQLNNLNEFKDLPVFIGGKSMGGRVAATISSQIFVEGTRHEDISNEKINKEASEQGNVPASYLLDKIKGVICLGYPFHPQNKPDKLRLEPLQQTQKPLLIIQGDRDALGDQAEINTYEFSPLCQVNFLQDGDHSFKPRVKSGFTQQQHLESTVKHMVDFINENR